MFARTGINITERRKHPGAALGSRSYFEQYYVGGEVEDWVGEVTRLAEFARSQPQASYAAFTFGLRQRWNIFYDNSAGCLDATAAFRMCNLGFAYTIAHRTKLF